MLSEQSFNEIQTPGPNPSHKKRSHCLHLINDQNDPFVFVSCFTYSFLSMIIGCPNCDILSEKMSSGHVSSASCGNHVGMGEFFLRT